MADSISMDAHKWLYQPLDCSLLLYRNAEIARSAFSYTGDYAKTLSDDPIESFAFFEESLELSRRFRALKLWLSLAMTGSPHSEARSPRISGRLGCSQSSSRESRHSSCSRRSS
jgi:glutamate/tyrosine decarboxylase-like PLP-dependent enzyme